MALWLNLGEILRVNAVKFPKQIAFCDASRHFTYPQTNVRVNRLANALAGLGVAKGDKVSCFMENSIEICELYLACAKIGAVINPINFRLVGPEGVCWVETKSVTLVTAGVAHFPDAPTARGSRHLRELMAIVQKGQRAAVVFIIQREDARSFAPAASVDPLFAQTLARAAAAGVEVRAYVCRVDMTEILLDHAIPVTLP